MDERIRSHWRVVVAAAGAALMGASVSAQNAIAVESISFSGSTDKLTLDGGPSDLFILNVSEPEGEQCILDSDCCTGDCTDGTCR